jgi:hypothetical protein
MHLFEIIFQNFWTFIGAMQLFILSAIVVAYLWKETLDAIIRWREAGQPICPYAGECDDDGRDDDEDIPFGDPDGPCGECEDCKAEREKAEREAAAGKQ